MAELLRTSHDIPKNAKIAIFGTGSAGVELKNYLLRKRKDVSISFFIDSYKQGVIDDIEIVNPKMINKYQEAYNCSLIIIASCYSQEIEKNLEKLGNQKLSNCQRNPFRT